MINKYFKSAWRKLWKHKTESVIHLAGLSIGMTAAVLIMLWVQNELSYDNYHPQGKQVYRITNHVPITKEETWVWENSPYSLTQKAAEEIPEIEAMGLLAPASYNTPIINMNGRLLKEKKAAYVSRGWFDVFKYDFIEGSPATFFQQPFSLLLTESGAKKYFGKKDPVGQVMRIDTLNYQVQAVVKDVPTNSSFQYDMLIPLDALQSNPNKKKQDLQWGNFSYITFIRLRAGTSLAQVTNKLNSLLDKNRKDNKITTSLLPLQQLHFDNTVQSSSFTAGNRQSVYIFAILAILLLIVACINYVNLTTARASLRSKEVSIRKIVGAARGSLFGQFMIESVLTSLLALLLTICFVQLCLPFFNRLTQQQFSLPFASGRFWGLITGTLATVTLLTGIYPALLLSSFKPISLFKGNNILKLKDVTLRKILVTTQFTVSVMLIAATLIIYGQLNYIRDQNSHFNRSQVFSFTVPYKVMGPYLRDEGKVNSFHNALKQELLTTPGVEQVSVANESVIDIQSSSSGNADWAGRPTDFEPALVRLSADANFPSLFGLQLVTGRWFRPNDKSDAMNSFILNETAIKQLKIRQPYIGQFFRFNGDSGQIVGVVKDFHFRSLHEAVTPLVYHTGDDWCSSYFIKIAPKSAATVLAKTEKIWNRTVPGEPFEYTFLDESFDKLYRAENKISMLMTLFAGIAIFISCLGLLGLAAFTTERRMKEIGIRKVLGASIRSIITLLSKEFFLLVLIAIVVATPVAWWTMDLWLQDFAYRIRISAWTFLSAGMIVVLITLIIVGLHGLRAAITNPVKSLRSE
ncbi:FtsX-like permease family protein [Pseudoflavitalea sp. X16]|uniref:ABC transporter permease n=1 Tax=Paraflavitalea devenefica TaxID=2716334 RepID=UPI001423B0B5|nr:ABC transporter permease [Paraflavitalea devenefica]NII28015.1 FtsX-like permease family protein [Paraflavitalea devenefica]